MTFWLRRNIDDVDKTMDEINEQTDNMKQIQDALSAPIGASADFDEACFQVLVLTYHQFISWIEKFELSTSLFQDELEAELEELEGAELEEQLLQPATTAPAAPSAPVHVPAGRRPAGPIPQRNKAEEDELAALQAEMAL